MDAREDERLMLAASGDEEVLAGLVHDPSPRVIRALLDNGKLREEDVLIIANRKNMTPDVLDAIAKNGKWSESYPIRLALAKNPKTPLSVSLSIVRYLRLFDIAEMTRNHNIPLVFRHKVEAIVIERIPTMPLGYKKSLAKMAVGNVLLKLLQDADAEVVALCLNNPRLQENHLFKVINRDDTYSETIRLIAMHQNWSGRSLIRYSLVRNEHTPLTLSERFLQSMKMQELRELYGDPLLPASVKPLVYRELFGRGVEPKEQTDEQIFEIDEDDDRVLEDFDTAGEEADEKGESG
ncbi:MAG TPA: hypothetical protein VEI57_14865 [Nitrospirota bacterium]|nr:hypothetical protein [Nitrospirota bacterium]